MPVPLEVWMRRSPLILALVLTATSSLAQTQTPTPSPTTSQPTTATPSSQSVAAAQAAAPPAALEEETAAPAQNARLAPGGVVAGGSSFPLGLQLTLDNSVGNGILAPGFQVQPLFSTAVNVRPSFSVPKHDALPKMILTGSFDFYVANWLSASTNSTTFDRQVQLGDAVGALILPGLYTEQLTGIALSLVLSARAPLSLFSRQNNLITNIGASIQFAWNSPDTPIGGFFVQYIPSVRGNFFSQVGASTPCSTPGFVPPRTNNPGDGISELPVYVGRVEQLLENGECILPGRQVLATIGNSVNTGWSTSDGAHNVSLGLSWSHSFARALSNKPGLSSPNASSQNFVEGSSGSLAYTYTVPVDFRLYLTGGVFTQNVSAYNNQGGIRFPIYDFATPANNLSSAFFDVTVGI